MSVHDRYLFRGKRVDDYKKGEWEHGHLCMSKAFDGGEWNIPTIQDAKGYRREVDPATLGQCTGLKDKNGKLIFEGDIVRFVRNGTGVVAWNKYELAWEFSKPNSLVCYNGYAGDMYKIIGNIHDNPELLGGEGAE